ncbi:MAG: hypothetical protein GXX99_08400 [Clostridiales bacterium]|nr:hypothetical protein [Clostridiales bacterium]
MTLRTLWHSVWTVLVSVLFFLYLYYVGLPVINSSRQELFFKPGYTLRSIAPFVLAALPPSVAYVFWMVARIRRSTFLRTLILPCAAVNLYFVLAYWATLLNDAQRLSDGIYHGLIAQLFMLPLYIMAGLACGMAMDIVAWDKRPRGEENDGDRQDPEP